MLSRFHEDGYLFFRQLLAPEKILKLRAEIIHTLYDAGWLEEDATEAIPKQPIRLKANDDYWIGYAAVQRLESVHRTANDPTLLSTFQRLINAPIVMHPRKFVRIVPPYALDDFSITPSHQDFRYVQGSIDVLSAWIPLGACPVSMGGLRILHGSHRNGLRAVYGGRSFHRCSSVGVDDHDPDWLYCDYQPGDVLIFHSLTIHSGTANQTDQYRLSLDCRCSSITEPMSSEQLLPPYHPKVPGWDELSHGWSTTKWIDVPDDISILPFSDPTGKFSLSDSQLMSRTGS
jgi:hypothetical protein